MSKTGSCDRNKIQMKDPNFQISISTIVPFLPKHKYVINQEW